MYEVAIIGGGIAGLTLSIDLRKRGYDVVLIEKGTYPRHKVCGEYISMESYDYLHHICPALNALNLPMITHFKLSSTADRVFQTPLDLGGFGISRYVLENLLYNEAKMKGVVFLLKCKALDIKHPSKESAYTITTNHGSVNSNLVCNASGRKSTFETKIRDENVPDTNYVGIKYHVKIARDPAVVEIHNFPGGYCGISAIEEHKSCLCYIVNSNNLKAVHNSIPELEKAYLYQNAHLKHIFDNSDFLFNEPLTISGINFKIKKPVIDGIFYLGDAAGSIAPVTGNGMSIAIRSASNMAAAFDSYFLKRITKQQLIISYTTFWKKEFSTKIKLSRHFQKLSEYPALTNLSIGLFKPFPILAKTIIRKTHGIPF